MASFFNVVGVLITLAVLFAALFLLARALQFFKTLVFKIRIILKNVPEPVPLDRFACYENSDPKDFFPRAERVYQYEVKRSKNFNIINVLALLFERYNHLLYLPFRRLAVEKLLLLRPTKEFYFLLYAKNLAVVWILAVFIAGLHYARGSSMSLS